jgi:hypothetical protein
LTVQSCPSEGRHNLGAWLAPDGNNVVDLSVLCSKGKMMSTNIAASHLQREEVSIAYKMMLCPAMKYSLSCTTLSHPECNTVDRSYLLTLLSRMGISKCTKRLLLFGPPSLGALGFTNTWTDQRIAQVQLLLGHLCQGQEIGQLVQVQMETLQMVIVSSLTISYSADLEVL